MFGIQETFLANISRGCGEEGARCSGFLSELLSVHTDAQAGLTHTGWVPACPG